MRIDVVAVIPDIVKCFIDYSIVKRAREKGVVSIFVHDLRDYGIGRYRQIDDIPYGGGAGMVLRPEPYAKIIDKLTSEREYDEVIMLSPAGELFNQRMANELSMKQNLIILCGHYKGVDERVTQLFATREISIGDYVLTAGELAAAVVIDAVVRLLPGVLGDEMSALTDSFQDGLLAPPVYTRPPEFRGLKVPDVLRSGHHAKIAEWQWEQSLERTRQRRPDLYKKFLEKAQRLGTKHENKRK